MYRRFDEQQGLEMVTILPGEFYSTNASEIIQTILGSCVSVVLMDETSGICGMNHFMLAHSLGQDKYYQTQSGRYGMHAMELLVNEMLRLGARRSRISAKLFGGGSVLRFEGPRASNIPDENVMFARKYLETEHFPLVSSDTGGDYGRKVLVFTGTGRVLVKKLGRTAEISAEERQYLEKLRKRQDRTDVTLFDKS